MNLSYFGNKSRCTRHFGCSACIHLGQLAVHKLFQLGLAEGAHFGRGQRTVLENHQSRDAADAKLGWDASILIDIDFGNAEFALKTLRDLVEDRGDHLAGATPLGPKIDQNRGARFQDILIKRSIRYVFDKVACHVAGPLSFVALAVLKQKTQL